MSEGQGAEEGATPGWATRARRLAVPALLAGLLVLALLCVSHRYRVCHAYCFNSDDLYCVELCQDILGRGYERSGWHIPYAPQVFPELVLLVPCVYLFRDLVLIFLAYNCLYYGIMLAVLFALFRSAGLRARAAFLFAAAGQLFLLGALLDPTCGGWIPSLYVPACHNGAVLAGLILWLIVIRAVHRPIGWLGGGLFVGLGGLAIFSDRLVLAQFIGPICLTVFGLALLRAVRWRKALEMFVLTGAAYACAAATQYAFSRSNVVLLPLGLIVDFSLIGEALEKFLANLPTYVQGQYLVHATFFTLLLVASVAGVVQALKARRARLAVAAGTDTGAEAERRARTAAAAIALAAVLACLCNLASIVLSGVGRYAGTPRYLLAALLVPFLFLGVCLHFLPGRRLALLGRAFPLVIALFAVFELTRRGGAPPFKLRELRQPYPELARTLDRLAREGKISRGIATYWNARGNQYRTRTGVHIKVVHGHGEPWLHLQNPNSYLAPGRGRLEVPHYNFILFDDKQRDHPMRSEDLCRYFGSPREKVPCGGMEIWIYDGLIGTPFTHYLRSALAYRCRTQLRCIGPVAPPGLARGLRNFAEPEPGRRVELKPDGEVKVEFAEPMRGALVDLGAAYDGHYEVTFYHGSEALGSVYVPRANFAAASTPYLKGAGNQSRLVTVPPAARARGWTAATVKAAGGPGTFALSHFLVYEDTDRLICARQMAPGGRWRFEAEVQCSWLQGPESVASDSAASEGKARVSPRSFAGPVTHGPYLLLEHGRYRAEFYLKAGPDVPAGHLGFIDVSSENGKRIHLRREFQAAHLAGEGYHKLTLEFGSDVDLADCEFRVISYGKVPLYVDRVELVCEQ